MSRWSRCEFCDRRGHTIDNCPQYRGIMDSPRTEEDNKRDARIWENLKNNPTFQEETNRRRAARWAGNDPDKPARVPRWKRRRDGR